MIAERLAGHPGLVQGVGVRRADLQCRVEGVGGFLGPVGGQVGTAQEEIRRLEGRVDVGHLGVLAQVDEALEDGDGCFRLIGRLMGDTQHQQRPFVVGIGLEDLPGLGERLPIAGPSDVDLGQSEAGVGVVGVGPDGVFEFLDGHLQR